MGIDKELLDILACPKCKAPVALNRAGDGLLCEACALLYEIEDDIPIMLIDEARAFSAVSADRKQTAGRAGKASAAQKPKKKPKKKPAKKPAKKKPAKKPKKKPAKNKPAKKKASKSGGSEPAKD